MRKFDVRGHVIQVCHVDLTNVILITMVIIVIVIIMIMIIIMTIIMAILIMKIRISIMLKYIFVLVNNSSVAYKA